MRTIKRIFIHCTASHQNTTTEKSLRAEFKAKGWRNPGYHYVIMPDGRIINMLSEDKVSNGVAGYNSTSINVAYVGGIDSKLKAVDNRTPAQKSALLMLLRTLRVKYPKALILGHRDISPDKNKNGKVDSFEYIKQCPCFNAMIEYADLNKGLL